MAHLSLNQTTVKHSKEPFPRSIDLIIIDYYTLHSLGSAIVERLKSLGYKLVSTVDNDAGPAYTMYKHIMLYKGCTIIYFGDGPKADINMNYALIDIEDLYLPDKLKLLKEFTKGGDDDDNDDDSKDDSNNKDQLFALQHVIQSSLYEEIYAKRNVVRNDITLIILRVLKKIVNAAIKESKNT